MTTRYVDFSGLRVSGSRLRADGCAGVFRYLSPPANVAANAQWKIIGKAEFNDLIAHNIEVVLNWEWYEGRCLEGARAGTQDGAWAYAAARALGYNKGAKIYISHDTGARNDLAVASYIRAFVGQLKGYYEGRAIYSGVDTCQAMRNVGLARGVWQTLAWSGGRIGPGTNAYQNGNRWYNGQADEDIIYSSVGGHLANKPVPAPAPKPKPKPKPVPKPVPKPKPKPPGWPSYMRPGDYFGLVTGPAHSHGGYFVGERPAIKMIQQKLQALGFAPRTAGWADGIFGPPTETAVAKFQRKYMPHTTFYGQVWSDDWAKLFSL